MNPTWTKNVLAAIANSAHDVLEHHALLVDAAKDNPTALAKVDLILTDKERAALEAIVERGKTAAKVISDRQEAVDIF